MAKRGGKTAQRFTPTRTKSKVGILGFAETYKQAPFDEHQDWEFWGLNELYKYVTTWDRWFEMHDAETLGVTKRDLSEGEQKRHLEWLRRKHGKPVYMLPQFVQDGQFPDATAYPLEAMTHLFGRYFTSTIGYMMALAIAEGFETIGLWGVDLASDIEYPQQRPNTEYLIGIARGQGRTVIVPEQAAILKAGFLYGYETPIKEMGGMALAVQAHKAELVKKHEQTLATLNTLDGAIQECDNFVKLMNYKDRGVHIEKY